MATTKAIKTIIKDMTVVRTVNLTPTWRGLLPAMVEVAANGTTAAARKIAMDELYRLADAVDRMNADAKGKE